MNEDLLVNHARSKNCVDILSEEELLLFLLLALVSDELLLGRIRLAMWAYENDRSLIKQKIERG